MRDNNESKNNSIVNCISIENKWTKRMSESRIYRYCG